MRRSLGVLAAVAVLATAAMPVAARSPGDVVSVTRNTATRYVQGSKSASGRLAQSDAGLLSRTDSRLVNVMVKLDVDSLSSYEGGLPGLAATSPSVTGKTLKQNPGAVAAYRNHINLMANGVRRSVQRTVGRISLGRTFTVAYGGFAARLPANRAKDLLKISGVAAVQYDKVNQPTANDSPIFVGATAVWPSLGGSSKAGMGVKVGILDTGVWPEHPMFNDPGIPHPGGTYDCDFGLSGETNDPAFTCNDKLIGAYAFLDTNIAVTGTDPDEYCTSDTTCSARDADGHGTHTATTAAGSPDNHATLYGVDYGRKSGIAPGASVIGYRVCDLDGCFSSDSVAAVEQAILDDVDVINFSISGGSNAYSDAVELAFLDAYAAGILVNASAGNAGPGAGTANHAGPWTNTVGASTLDREFGTTLHLANGATLDLDGVTITNGVTSAAPVVLGKDTESGELCDTVASPGEYTGMVVACQRGSIARVEKGYNVLQGGAVGMILYNVSVTDLETDNHWLPTIHVNDPSETIEAFVTAHPSATAMWSAGTPQPTLGDMMASFSSRGPLGDFIKPDVTAPGVQIFAGASPEHHDDPAEGLGPDGELYQAIAGTSMSSPHAAGVAALLKAAHPNWTPGQIKSAMMTSSLQDVVKEDGSTAADPFDRGAGSIRANRAVTPTVTFDVKPHEYYASSSDELGRIDLNLPSIYASQMNGVVTTTRTVRNVTGDSQVIDVVATDTPSNTTFTFSPSVLRLDPWGSATFTITINAVYAADGLYFGEITLNPRRAGALNAVMPVAFNKEPGEITLENSCDAPPTVVSGTLTIAKGDTADCQVTVTNYANTDANVQVRVNAPNTGRLILKNWSAGNKRNNGFIWNGSLTPALPPEIESITSPGYGYLSANALGDFLSIPPESGYGDETIGVYEGVSPYVFGGELYDTISIDSNGYVVLGSADAEDNNCCDPAMPDTARPNNVLAPYWTDLDPSAGGEIWFLTINFGGGAIYHIIEWRQVPVWGTTNERTAQVWILANGSDEDVSFEYCIDPNDLSYPDDGCDDSAPGLLGAGSSDGLIVGAENRDGTSAATIGPMDTQPSNLGYVVNAGEPTAGGSMTIDYDAFGKNTGRFDIKARMTSDITLGTTVDVFRIRVVNAAP